MHNLNMDTDFNSVLRFFRAGYKPALLCTSRQMPDFLKQYPNCYTPHTGKPLFFQSQDLRDAYMFQSKQDFSDSFLSGRRYDPHRLLGLALGYPPSAVDAFCNMPIKEFTKTNIGVFYCGMIFSTLPALLDENLFWLRSRYQIPEHLEVVWVKPVINGSAWLSYEKYREVGGS